MSLKNLLITFAISGILLTGLFGSRNSFAAEDVISDEAPQKWTGSIFMGYNNTSGNTKKATGSLTAEAVKKFQTSQLTFKGNFLYSETNNKMDGQKWDALGKYSQDFGSDLRLFRFVQLFIDHDYFADIDHRITPSAGLGYHIAREEDWIWDVDGGLAYRITKHRIATDEDDNVLTALLHTFLKKKVLDNAFLSEDLTVYPGLETNSAITLRSESAFTNPISTNLDLELKYIIDFNSQPAADKKSTDKQLVAGVKYKF